MAQALFGSHRLFATTSPWILGFALYASVMILVLLGRRIFEGEAYNVSWSAVVGGAALFACMSIAGDVLHQPNLVLPGWLTSRLFHLIGAELSGTIGLFMGLLAIYQTTWRKSQWVDLAFNFLLAPLFIYGLATLLPVVFFQGTKMQFVLTGICILVYVIAFRYDAETGRLDQPGWRKAHPNRNSPWS